MSFKVEESFAALNLKQGDYIAITYRVKVARVSGRATYIVTDEGANAPHGRVFNARGADVTVIERAKPPVPAFWPPRPGDVWETPDGEAFYWSPGNLLRKIGCWVAFPAAETLNHYPDLKLAYRKGVTL